MTKEEYNKVFEALRIEFLKARHMRITKPFSVFQYEENYNNIILVHSGQIAGGDKDEVIGPGQVLFVPAKHKTHFRSVDGQPIILTTEHFFSGRDSFYEPLDAGHDFSQDTTISIFSFETKIFLDVDFFHTLELPSFAIKDNEIITGLLQHAVAEHLGSRPGNARLVKVDLERLVVEVLRHVMDRKVFLEQIATNIVYFKDPRLVKIFYHIRRNINGDLSNKVLARLADVSEDYVGQYFKSLTGINPQDYIEYQRMEQAIDLLRTTKLSIAEIGEKVGFNGTAYFCRRFKMMFGIPAAKMRRRENQQAQGGSDYDDDSDYGDDDE